jgi:hypothetical protein
MTGLDLGGEEGECGSSRIAPIPGLVLPGEGVEPVGDGQVEE